LDLLALDGKELDKETVDKLAKDNFKIPLSSCQLWHQLNNWAGILQLVFEAESKILLEALEWIKHINKYETSYDASFKIDNDFSAKICGIIDLSTYQFLNSWMTGKLPDEKTHLTCYHSITRGLTSSGIALLQTSPRTWLSWSPQWIHLMMISCALPRKRREMIRTKTTVI